MLQYMEQKYQEPFTMLGPYGGQIGKLDKTILMSSRRCPKAQIMVRMQKEKSGTLYQDNYPAYLKREEIERIVGQLAGAVLGECKVFYKIPWQVFPEDFPVDLSGEEFLRHPDTQAVFYFYPKNRQPDAENRLQQLAVHLTAEKFFIGGVLSYPERDLMYENLRADNFYREDTGYQAYREVSFRILPSGEFAYTEWR